MLSTDTTSEYAMTEQLSLFQQIREDVACVFERDPAARTTFEVLTTYPGVHALLFHRVAFKLWQRGWRYLARLVSFVSRLLTNIDIHPGATIGRRLFIDHGIGVVIGETAIIGNDVTLYHGVTLGGTSWNKGRRHPSLGDNVLIGAGAKVLGAISIGNNVRVGANSVVVRDIPPNCSVVGIPGKIVRTGIPQKTAFGIDLDHHLIPDPVGRAMTCMLERIVELERQLNEGKILKKSPDPCPACEALDVCICEQTGEHCR